MTFRLSAALFGLMTGVALYSICIGGRQRWRAVAGRYIVWLQDECQRDLMPVAPGTLARGLTVAVVAAALLGFAIGGSIWQRTWLSLAGGCAGYWMPTLILRAFQRTRRRRIDRQLAPALTLMSAGLRAGLSLQQALELVVREQSAPIAEEFALVVKAVRLGRRLDEALQGLARRLPNEDVGLFVDSVLTLRGTGGDLTRSFQVIADTILERQRIEERIRTITSEAFLQGIVMCLIPPVMLAVFAVFDPRSIAPLIGHPAGWGLLGLVTTLTAIGFFFMRRVVRIDV